MSRPAATNDEMTGWAMISDTSRAGISLGLTGTGRKPRASAQATRPIPKTVSNRVSGTKVAISVA